MDTQQLNFILTLARLHEAAAASSQPLFNGSEPFN